MGVNIIINFITSLLFKRKKVALLIGIIIVSVGYVWYTHTSKTILINKLEDVEREAVIKESEIIVSSSNTINEIRFKNLEDAIDGTRYMEEDLPEDYIDPDYGKIFTFGE